jgi:hypothetical protein
VNLSQGLNTAGLVGIIVGVGMLVLAVIAALWRSRRQPVSRRPREVAYVSWPKADELLRQNVGWRIAPEEDHNPSCSLVYLEREAPDSAAPDLVQPMRPSRRMR